MISHCSRLYSMSSCRISSPQSNRFPRSSLVGPLIGSSPIEAESAQGDTTGSYGIVAGYAESDSGFLNDIGLGSIYVIPPEVSSTPPAYRRVGSASRRLGQPSEQTPHKEARWHEMAKQAIASRQVVIISNHCQAGIRRSGLQTNARLSSIYARVLTHVRHQRWTSIVIAITEIRGRLQVSGRRGTGGSTVRSNLSRKMRDTHQKQD